MHHRRYQLQKLPFSGSNGQGVQLLDTPHVRPKLGGFCVQFMKTEEFLFSRKSKGRLKVRILPRQLRTLQGKNKGRGQVQPGVHVVMQIQELAINRVFILIRHTERGGRQLRQGRQVVFNFRERLSIPTPIFHLQLF